MTSTTSGMSAHDVQTHVQDLAACVRKATDRLPDGLHLKAMLEEVVEIGGRTDKVVLAGNGNVGKSSIANTFLGEKAFWPVSKARLTRRVCKTHYGERKEYQRGGEIISKREDQAIPKELVSNGANVQQEPLEAWTPSTFLEPAVTLIDLPGLDQEEQHMEMLRDFVKNTPANEVVLLHILDVNQGMVKADRQFLEELKSSAWSEVSLRLLLVVNKCDKEQQEEEDDPSEVAPDLEELVEEVRREADNYCMPAVYRVSMKDLKRGDEMAGEDWNELLAAVQDAIVLRKQHRWQHCRHEVERAMTGLELIVDSGKKVKRMKAALSKTYEELGKLTAGRAMTVERRAMEIQTALQSNREAHLKAVMRNRVPHESETVSKQQAVEVEKEIIGGITAMVQNDIQIAMLDSAEFGELPNRFQRLFRGVGIGIIASAVVGVTGGFSVFVLGGWWYMATHAVVDESFKKQVFEKFYDWCVGQARSIAEKEFDTLFADLKREIDSNEQMIAEAKAGPQGCDVSICEGLDPSICETILEELKHDMAGLTCVGALLSRDDSSIDPQAAWELVSEVSSRSE